MSTQDTTLDAIRRREKEGDRAFHVGDRSALLLRLDAMTVERDNLAAQLVEADAEVRRLEDERDARDGVSHG